jgi:hypothetical protein
MRQIRRLRQEKPLMNESVKLPTITPQMLPMPPSTSIESTSTLTLNCRTDRVRPAQLGRVRAPAKPLNDAPSANAASLAVVVLMPMWRAGEFVFADRHPRAAEPARLQVGREQHGDRDQASITS